MTQMVLIPKDKYERLVNRGETSAKTEHEHHRLNEDIILTFLNPRHKIRGQTLLNTLANVIDWNYKGEIISQNECVPGSHIADLLKACLHHYKDYERFEGLTEFCTALKESNIPLTLIGNAHLRHTIETYKGTQPKITSPMHKKQWISL